MHKLPIVLTEKDRKKGLEKVKKLMKERGIDADNNEKQA